MENRQTLFVGLSFLAIGLMIGLVFTEGIPIDGRYDAEELQENAVNDLEFVSVSEDDDAVMGDEDAPVVIVEFSDYQCPYCALFHEETLPLIKENYIDTGKVKFIYRDFPIPSHTDADMAAQAAECARTEGGDEAYYAMHDRLFENQALWSFQENAEELVLGYATELGYNIETCLDSEEIIAEVAADYAAARSYGVTGTPTFFINGKKLVGAYPYEVFEQLIEAEL